MFKYLAVIFSVFLISPAFGTGTLILMRHSEADSNVRQVYNTNPKNAGYTKMHLTSRGREQAHEAGKQLRKDLRTRQVKIDLVYHSPLPRADEAAHIAYEAIGALPVEFVSSARIIENDMGLFEGRPYSEFPYKHSDLSHNHDENIRGETLDDVRTRIRDFLGSVVPASRMANMTLLIVSHGTPCRLMLEALGLPGRDLGYAEYVIVQNPELH